ncbi:MAG: hypothetical protein E6J20_19380 [Chloroflexi bacterium]|nr:MAG: hypothetical protein E6J20_19380 [Chloroflexota bacterium]
MGYKAKKKLYKLTFAEDTDMDGLEVTMTSISTGQMLRLQQLSGMGAAATKDPKIFGEMIGIFAGAIKSWNLEDDDDTPVPATVDGAMAQDPDFIMVIISSWCLAIVGVSGPLDGPSTSGANALEASMPMDALSSSPPS